MKIGIVGSRGFNDLNAMIEFIFQYIMIEAITCVVSGGAIGADKLGEHFADLYNLEKEIYYPDWKNLGKAAGMIRNTDIVLNSHRVFIFWDGKSKGTQDTIRKCIKYKIPHHIYRIDDLALNKPVRGFEI